MVESHIRSRSLRSSEIDLAYPLVRVGSPRLELQPWRDIVGSFFPPVADMGTLRGVLVAEVGGVLRGLLTHEPAPAPSKEDILIAANIVIPGVFEARPVVGSLAEAVAGIAEASNYSRIRIDLPKEMANLHLDWLRQSKKLSRISMAVTVTNGGLRPALSSGERP